MAVAQAGCVLCSRMGRQSGAAPGELRRTKLITLPASQSGRPHGKTPTVVRRQKSEGRAEDTAFIGVSAKKAGPGEISLPSPAAPSPSRVPLPQLFLPLHLGSGAVCEPLFNDRLHRIP